VSVIFANIILRDHLRINFRTLVFNQVPIIKFQIDITFSNPAGK